MKLNLACRLCRCLSTDPVLHAYDAAGCVTSIERTGKPDLSMTWNGQYQLTSVSTNGVVAESYTYDPLGRRASTTSGGATVRHVYDGAHCVADLDAAGAVVRSYTWGPGIDNLLAVTCHSGSSSTTYYALTDIQGTVHGFADADGNLVARYTYDAWGNLLDSDVAVSGLADNRYLFQGREYSWATGLYNFRARWYDPATGRWLSKDPIGISGGLNLYAFCGDDPVNYVDPWGLCEKGSKWDQMAWWEKLGKGYYYGTGYGEDALQYYVDITLDPNAAWYQKGSAWTLFSAYGMRDAGNLKFDGPSGTRRFQVRDRTTGEPHFRVDKGPVPGKDGPRFHYHRRPDLSKHRPYEGL